MDDLLLLTPENMTQYWPDTAKLLEKGLSFDLADTTIDQMRLLVLQGRIEVLIKLRAGVVINAMAYEFQDRPNARIAYVISIAGPGAYDRARLDGWKAYLKARGAVRFEGAARPAIARLLKRLGMVEAYTIMRGEL